jgi:hypothetical protein
MAERSSLATASSASQSGRFSLLVPFVPRSRFCGPKGPNFLRITARWFSKPQNFPSIGPFFSEAVSRSAFSRDKGNRPFELTTLLQSVSSFFSVPMARQKHRFSGRIRGLYRQRLFHAMAAILDNAK